MRPALRLFLRLLTPSVSDAYTPEREGAPNHGLVWTESGAPTVDRRPPRWRNAAREGESMGSDVDTRVAAGRARSGFKRVAFVVAATPVVLFTLQACGGSAGAPTAAPTVAPPPTVVSDMTQTAPTITAAASQVASAVASPVAAASPIAAASP